MKEETDAKAVLSYSGGRYRQFQLGRETGARIVAMECVHPGEKRRGPGW